MFEPAFDIYMAQAETAGAVVKTVPLRVKECKSNGPSWYFEEEELRGAFNDNTRLLLLNTPHNPTGTGDGSCLLYCVSVMPRRVARLDSTQIL